ncbi:hypothetical protein G3R49_09265 [Shewanella sp. WXL01]|uniref:hypothetical protein n=1 Tax=Shewanella sp. WXL01 TaxID=2709721 RepID=UPI001438428D|nr:hypothetical protein [Shewanella sp. WXL01]NKF50758.1 hypothetical protein [Shewanella sp. WXL01]
MAIRHDAKRYRFRVRRLPHGAAASNLPSSINHPLHFCLTICTFGFWGIVWWHLILKSRGEHNFITALDDDYWSYLIEREQPPAALYQLRVNPRAQGKFEA